MLWLLQWHSPGVLLYSEPCMGPRFSHARQGTFRGQTRTVCIRRTRGSMGAVQFSDSLRIRS